MAQSMAAVEYGLCLYSLLGKEKPVLRRINAGHYASSRRTQSGSFIGDKIRHPMDFSLFVSFSSFI